MLWPSHTATTKSNFSFVWHTVHTHTAVTNHNTHFKINQKQALAGLLHCILCAAKAIRKDLWHQSYITSTVKHCQWKHCHQLIHKHTSKKLLFLHVAAAAISSLELKAHLLRQSLNAVPLNVIKRAAVRCIGCHTFAKIMNDNPDMFIAINFRGGTIPVFPIPFPSATFSCQQFETLAMLKTSHAATKS